MDADVSFYGTKVPVLQRVQGHVPFGTGEEDFCRDSTIHGHLT